MPGGERSQLARQPRAGRPDRLAERITLYLDYGTRPAILTSFEVLMRPEAGLLGEMLRRSARSRA